MVLYNTTYAVNGEVASDWLHWMKRFYLPAAMATGLPISFKILRLLTELDKDGVTYSVQLDFSTLEEYTTFQNRHVDQLHKRIQHRFGNQFISFDTLLEDA